MKREDHRLIGEKALRDFAEKTAFVLQRFQLERAVLALDSAARASGHSRSLEAIALIRAAYDCSVGDAEIILAAVKRVR